MAVGSSKSKWALAIALIALATVVSVWAALVRNERESSYRTASVCLDYDEFSVLAARWQDGPSDFWADMKEAGATSVAVSEITIGWLEDSSRLRIEKSATGGEPVMLLKPEDGKTQSLIRQRLPLRMPQSVISPDGAISVAGLSYEQLRAVNVGPNDFIAELAENAGLSVVHRLSSFGGFNADWAEAALAPSIKPGSVVIFPEKQVAGFPNRIEEISGILKNIGASVGVVEFSSQLGMDELSEAMLPHVVRVHSIKAEELAKGMPIEVAADRFARAVRERAMRIMYLNPYQFAGEDTDVPAYNVEYVRQVSEGVKSSGFRLGGVEVPASPGIDKRILLMATALAAAASIYLLIQPFSESFATFLSAVSAVVLSSSALLLPESIGSMLVPFAAAIGMGCLSAYTWIKCAARKNRKGLLNSVKAWAVASAVSVAGGFIIASPVADTGHMLGVGVFFGVKISQLIPIAFAIVAFWALAISKKKGTPLIKDAIVLGLEPIRWWQAAAVGIAGIAGLYMILRSGNASASYVTGFETTVRMALEKLLVFRPRSKEVFIGHPAMIVAGLLMSDGYTVLALAAFTLGMVGQVSMINTFMHLHTPIAATAIRTALGLALGLATGLLAAAIYKRAVNAARKWWPKG